MDEKRTARMPKPEWIRTRLCGAGGMSKTDRLLRSLSLHTVCEEADCPNIGECYGRGTATFMILGRVCTRGCTFCAVEKGLPCPPDEGEPLRVAEAVKAMGLRHVVVTTVTRDDLADGGAAQFASTVERIRELSPDTTIELLISDLGGSLPALEKIVRARPDIIGHNIETVPRLYGQVRPQADYARSMGIIRAVKELGGGGILSKSGLMVGLGESRDEVAAVMSDLRGAGCDIVTIGQYLQPSPSHHPVIEYVHPDVFREYERQAYQMGFLFVASGPLVRSSYMAERAIWGTQGLNRAGPMR